MITERCAYCGQQHEPTTPCASGGRRVGLVLDGKYAVSRLLGEGGMGEVYEARHTKLGRRVAVKFLFAQYARRPEVARRFENEAMTAGSLEHENVAAVYDVGALPDGAQYLVMEFLDGEDLDKVLQRCGRLALARAADIVVQACHGLDEVHRRGMVHRDLKPANLFLLRRPNGADLVKIIDFGIAKLRSDHVALDATKTGMAIGTPHYMSPEQGRGEKNISPASDIYALGVILFELLSGERPHQGSSPFEIVHKMLTEPAAPLEPLAPGLAPQVYAIVRKAMAAQPTDRFASASEMAAALTPFAAAGSGQIAPLPPPVPSSAATALEPPVTGPSPSTLTAADLPLTLPSGAAKPRIGLAIALGALGVLAVAAGAVGVLSARGSRHDAAAAAAMAAGSPLIPPAASAPSAGPSADLVPPPSTDAPKESSANSAGGMATTVPPKARASTAPPAGSGAATKTSTAPSPRAKPDCTQKYTVDRDGNRHFRPECFTNP
jgi:serine/threonine-protein kinase